MDQPKSILKGSGFVLQESTFYEGKYIAVKSIFGEVVLVSNSVESMIGICGIIAPYAEINEGMTEDVALFAKKYVSYACDANQALITAQAEQIKMLRSTLIDTLAVVQGGLSSTIENGVKALEATKEQA